ncbi:MAG: tRNA-dihydrouridine synthase family protein [Holophagaceae bacterium]|nr:tRNA-dihydrouridine synthase family protein [Holophagaceae bacterium]
MAPAIFLAPMAGITHSAFRRLISDFGGYGALFSEMLSGSAFIHEKPGDSSFTKRRPNEGHLIYQFRLSGYENIEAVFAKITELEYLAIDINLGCPAPEIQHQESGVALFRDFDRLKSVLQRIRKIYKGPLTVKCRLGDDKNWQKPFKDRLALFEDNDVVALTLHPRLSTERLARRARWEVFPWLAQTTTIPIIGNGDICSPKEIKVHRTDFETLSGLMLGRIAIVKPWIFREFAGLNPVHINYAEVWERFYNYIQEDMPPEKAPGRVKEFTHYFSGNFVFGHLLRKSIQKSKNLQEICDITLIFLKSDPEIRVNAGIPF